MSVRRAWLLVLQMGCGRWNFDQQADAPIQDATGDSTDAPPPCVYTPFGSAELVPNINAPGYDGSPSSSADGLRLYFATTRTPDQEIFVATRTSTSLEFDPPQLATDLSSTAFEVGPSLTADDLEIVFTSGRGGPGDIYGSRRNLPTEPFPTPMRVLTAGTRDGPEISGDGLTLFWMEGPMGTRDIHWASRSAIGQPFTVHGLRSDLNTPMDDALPSLSRDRLDMYFRSTRSGTARLWVAHRETDASAFEPATPLAELDALGATIEDPEITDDNLVLYFSVGATSAREIWRARRSCL